MPDKYIGNGSEIFTRVVDAIKILVNKKFVIAGASSFAIGLGLIPYLTDYKQWLQIQVPGGLPGNRFGYLLSWLFTLMLTRKRRDPNTVKSIDSKGYLDPEKLPERPYPLPEIAKWSIPHRQVTQIAYDIAEDNTPKSNVAKLFNAIAKESRECFVGQSKVEKHLTALFYKTRRHRNEIIHRHVKDGSFHVSLHCEDAKTVIRKNWGELHPGLPPFTKSSSSEFVMIYAPQNEDDYNVYRLIIEAALKNFE